MAEREIPSRPPLEIAQQHFADQEKQQERVAKATDLSNRARELIWDYAPVKYKDFSDNYSYRYIEPGTVTTPKATLDTTGATLEMQVAGEYVAETRPHSHPNSVLPIKVSLSTRFGDQQSSIDLHYDVEGRLDQNRLPGIPALETGIKIVNLIGDSYTKQGRKPNQRTSSSDHW
jgi:hypothetical protein